MSAPSVPDLLDDLAAESADLDGIVADLPESRWHTATPAAGWDVADTITHIHSTDGDALLALTDPPAFAALLDRLLAGGAADFTEGQVRGGRGRPQAELLTAWRDRREELRAAIAAQDPTARIVWFGPPMKAASFVTARLMETWAHGQDVADALGVRREPTDRLRHVADLGYRTRGYAYAIRGLTVPDVPVRVELTGPGGGTWGSPDATDRISGPALDFCLLVAQRAHPSDLALDVAGPAATEWVGIAQAFAGAPGPGRGPTRAAAQ